MGKISNVASTYTGVWKRSPTENRDTEIIDKVTKSRRGISRVCLFLSLWIDLDWWRTVFEDFSSFFDRWRHWGAFLKLLLRRRKSWMIYFGSCSRFGCTGLTRTSVVEGFRNSELAAGAAWQGVVDLKLFSATFIYLERIVRKHGRHVCMQCGVSELHPKCLPCLNGKFARCFIATSAALAQVFGCFCI